MYLTSTTFSFAWLLKNLLFGLTRRQRTFLEVNGLKDKIINTIREIIREKKPEEYEEARKVIKELIINAEMPKEIIEEINRAYMELSKRFSANAIPVAVRSSATAEDLRTASFAGQQDTYLNVVGIENVIKYIKYVWASI
jgi:pyruvate,water dikinase